MKSIKFKVKRKPKKSNSKVGPGYYMPENADALTKVKSSFALFNKTLARPSTLILSMKKIPGPGEYDSGRYFNTDKKPFTIGERRGVRFKDGPGVGMYEPG